MGSLFFFVLLFVIIKILHKQNAQDQKNSTSSTPYGPSIPLPPKPAAPTKEAVQKKVNQHLFGSADQPRDKYSLYKRLILTDRYTDLEKLAHELGITKYTAAREIKSLQKEGYFSDVEVDETNYKLIYKKPLEKDFRPSSKTKHTRKQATVPVSSKPETKTETGKEQSYVQPSAPYKADRNAAFRHEEWMPVPKDMHVVVCRYCGAENEVPNRGNAKRTCYFCREEL